MCQSEQLSQEIKVFFSQFEILYGYHISEVSLSLLI